MHVQYVISPGAANHPLLSHCIHITALHCVTSWAEEITEVLPQWMGGSLLPSPLSRSHQEAQAGNKHYC